MNPAPFCFALTNLGSRPRLQKSRRENGFQGTLDQAGSLSTTGTSSNLLIQKTSKWYNNDWNNFAPRFGFAWALNDKTSVRGAYGLYYDRIIGATISLVDGNTPGFSQSGLLYPNSSGTSDVRIGDGVPIAPVPSAPVLLQPATRTNSIVIFPPFGPATCTILPCRFSGNCSRTRSSTSATSALVA